MSKGSAVQLPQFLMSMDYGICYGPLDSINQVFVKEKPIWCGSMETYGSFLVDQPEIFGGQEGEGGVVGMVECYTGTDTQIMSKTLSKKVGLTPETAPGYRGIAHLFFRGETGEGGFLWGMNNPYLPATWVNVTRLPKQIAPEFSAIWPLDPDGQDPLASGDIPLVPSAAFLCPDPGSPPGHACKDGPKFEDMDDKVWSSWEPIPTLYVANEVAPDVVREGDLDAKVFLDIFNADSAVISDVDIDYGQVVLFLSVFFAEIDALIYQKVVYIQVAMPQFDANGDLVLDGGGRPIPDESSVINSPQLSPPPDPGDNTVIEYEVVGGEGGGEVPMALAIPHNFRFVRLKTAWSGATFGGRVTAVVSNSKYEWTKLVYGHCEADGTLGILPDANPAIMLHEALTNAEWGMGYPEASMGSSWATCAETLFDERFGLSMGWYKEATIQKMVSEIIDHINAMVYLDQATGLWEMKLIRDDYDATSLRIFDESNSKITSRQRKASGEIVNQITINYTDPANEENKTIIFQDPGMIAMQGGIVSASRDYYGCRNDFLANELGARDIRSASYPLFSCKVYADRSNRDLRPGDVVKVSCAEDGIIEMPVRVMKVDYGGPMRRRVALDVTEDIYGLETTSYEIVQQTLWDNPNTLPSPLDIHSVVTAPLPLLLRSGFSEADLSDDKYPEVVMAVFGYKQGMTSLGVYGPVLSPSGHEVTGQLVTVGPTQESEISTILGNEPYSIMSIGDVRAISHFLPLNAGDFIQLGDLESTAEIVMLYSYDSAASEWTVARGMLDTVPREWQVGTRAWYLGDKLSQLDPYGHFADAGSTYYFSPKMSGGSLPVIYAPPVAITPTSRPYCPLRPANCEIDGGGFAPVIYDSDAGIPSSVTLTWANRNRFTEDATAPKWDDGNVSPELSQTTTIRVRDANTGGLISETTGLTGTSHTYDISGLTELRDYDFEFIAERDGFESVQFAVRRLTLIRLGYGSNYGYDYGENDG